MLLTREKPKNLIISLELSKILLQDYKANWELYFTKKF